MSAEVQSHDSHHNLMVDNKKLFMWLFLGSDCMFFGTMISTHLIYRKLYPDSFDPKTLFSLELTSFSTFILCRLSFSKPSSLTRAANMSFSCPILMNSSLHFYISNELSSRRSFNPLI